MGIPRHQNLQATERPKHAYTCAIAAYVPHSIQNLHKNPNNKASSRGAMQPPAALFMKGRYDTAYIPEEVNKNPWTTGKRLPELMWAEVRKPEELERR